MFLYRRCWGWLGQSSTRMFTTGSAIMWQWNGGTIYGSTNRSQILFRIMHCRNWRMNSRRLRLTTVAGSFSLWGESQDTGRIRSPKQPMLWGQLWKTPALPIRISIGLHTKRAQQLWSNSCSLWERTISLEEFKIISMSLDGKMPPSMIFWTRCRNTSLSRISHSTNGRIAGFLHPHWTRGISSGTILTFLIMPPWRFIKIIIQMSTPNWDITKLG